MQSKGLIALVLATILVAAGAVLVSLGGSQARPEARAGQPVFAGLAARIGEVATIKIAGEGAATLERRGQGKEARWVVTERGAYPADQAKVGQTLLGFAELKLVETKTQQPGLYARLDVEDPGKPGGHARLVELDDASGRSMGSVIVGRRRPDRLGDGNDGLYVRRPGSAQSWLAQGSVDLPTATADWLDRKILSIPAGRVARVVLTHADGSRLVLARAKAGDKFAVEGAPADAKFKGDEVLAEPAGVLDGLELSDVQPAAALPLPAQGVARAEWTTFDGLTVTGATFDQNGKSWLVLAAAGTGTAAAEAAAIGARTKPWVFAVFAYKASAIKTKLADLLEPAKGS